LTAYASAARTQEGFERFMNSRALKVEVLAGHG
jgi:hypothetical protein